MLIVRAVHVFHLLECRAGGAQADEEVIKGTCLALQCSLLVTPRALLGTAKPYSLGEAVGTSRKYGMQSGWRPLMTLWRYRRPTAQWEGLTRTALQTGFEVFGLMERRPSGVGLLIRAQFLAQFNPIVEDRDWIEIEKGRAAVLRLEGEHGRLHIFVVYLASGADCKTQRLQSLQKISQKILPQEDALSVITGDFNYVPSERDRYSKNDGQWTGLLDREEEEAFARCLGLKFGFCELEQEHCTHENALARSRLDRIYTNQHLTEQLDRHYFCVALEWKRGLSAHRPISFGRRRSCAHSFAERPLPPAAMEDPTWPSRVSLRYEELRRDEPEAHQDQPLRKLVLMKKAIREVTLTMGKERRREQSKSTDDKLGFTIRFLRAAQEVRMRSMENCVPEYPFLVTLADHRDPNIRSSRKIAAVRAHALELARLAVTENLRELESNRYGIDSDAASRKRERAGDCSTPAPTSRCFLGFESRL